MAIWNSNGQDTGGSGSYVSGTQGVQYIHDTFASNGDTITLPTGTFTWTHGVLLTKDVYILGSGYTPNTVTGGNTPGAPTLATTVDFTATTSTTTYTWAIGVALLPSAGGGNYFRVSGIHFTSSTGGINSLSFAFFDIGTQNSVTGSSNSDPFRIDNCILDGASSQVITFRTEGNGIGCVLDHDTFIGGPASELVHINGLNPDTFGALGGWKDDVTPGSNQLVYLEDCIFQLYNYNSQANYLATSAIESFFGSRTCIRFSSFYLAQIDQHGTHGAVGTRWYEFYNLTFYNGTTAVANNSHSTWLALRGGSGFVYNITASPSNFFWFGVIYSDDSYSTSPTAAYVTSTWPSISPTTEWAPYGPGQGIAVSNAPQVPDDSSPVYVWGLDRTILEVGTQNGQSGASDIAENRNFFVSSSKPTNILLYEQASGAISNYNYTAFTYPHPLTGLSGSVPGYGLTAATDASIVRTLLGVSSGSYSVPANNYFACYSTQFTNAAKAGATEWSNSVNTNYARVAMGAGGAGWSIAAYANGQGVIWSNLNNVISPTVIGANQAFYGLGFCDSGTIGGGNVNFFIDLLTQLTIAIGQCVLLPAGTGASFTTY